MSMTYIDSKEPLDAIWVGGPPGQSFIKIKKKLARIGILVFQRYTVPDFIRKESLPVKTSLIFINKEITKHPAAKQAREFAAAAQIKCVVGGNDALTTLRNLQLKGILKKDADLASASNTMAKASKPETKETTPMSTPTRQGYNDEFTNCLRKYCGTHPTTSLAAFLKPEKKRKSQRILGLLQKLTTKSGPVWDVEDLKFTAGKTVWNLSAWRNERKPVCSYDSGQKRLFALAAHGLVERVEPFTGMDRATLSEPTLSLNFQLSAKGTAEMLKIDETYPVAPTPPLSEPELVTTPPEAPAAEPDKPAPVPVKPVREPLSKEGSKALVPVRKEPQADIKDAILLLQAAIMEQDPDVLEITIRDLHSESPVIDLIRRTRETFTI